MTKEIPKFKCKPSRSGDSKVLTIPADWINQGLVDPSKTFEVTLKEVEPKKIKKR